jgi:histidinol-phosphate aminotransferase
MNATWPSWLPLRESLTPLSPYGAPQIPATSALNTNENPFAPSAELIAAITKRVQQVSANLNRYPDRDAISLRTNLAGYINQENKTGFSSSNIWAANGSNEIIQSIFLAFGRDQALGFTPSYSMHPLISKVTGVAWIDGKRRADYSLDLDLALAEISLNSPTLTFITTPNNPSGTVVTYSELGKLAAATKAIGGLLVVDEAYAEFSSEKSAINLILEYPNVIVIRTMSKAFAFAGVRLGYLVADSIVIEALQLVRLPYHLSSITQAVSEVALSFAKELLSGVATLVEERELVSKKLVDLGLQVLPSSANFLLFSGFSATPAVLWQELLDQDILIRDVGLPEHLRVTIGTAAENQAFLFALTRILTKGEK